DTVTTSQAECATVRAPIEHRISMSTTTKPRIAFIGAGSTVFMKNLVGDLLMRPALSEATIALMDINPVRLEESAAVAGRLAEAIGSKASIETHSDQRAALAGADFVVVCFN